MSPTVLALASMNLAGLRRSPFGRRRVGAPSDRTILRHVTRVKITWLPVNGPLNHEMRRSSLNSSPGNAASSTTWRFRLVGVAVPCCPVGMGQEQNLVPLILKTGDE